MSRVTIVDIGNKAGVSFKTVSRVLNRDPAVTDALRQRVEAAMRELDYRPNRAARSLKGSRHFAIGLLVGAGEAVSLEENQVFGLPYLAEVQRGILHACRHADYNLVVDWVDLTSRSLAADLSRQLQNLRVDGVVVTPPIGDYKVALDTLESLGLAYARIAPGIDPGRSFAVSIDDRAAAHAMTRHLQGLGHRRIAFICGPARHIAAGERLTGYIEALRDTGEEMEPVIANGDFTFQSGMDAARDLLSAARPPTAIFAANDDMAAGVLAGAQLGGMSVPRDLSVAGFDNSATAQLVWPSLTTIHQPVALMSARAAQGLIDASAGQRRIGPVQVRLPFEIIERRSTAAPRQD